MCIIFDSKYLSGRVGPGLIWCIVYDKCAIQFSSSQHQILNFYLSSPLSSLSGLSLVVGLVLYISNINDEMLNRTKTNEAYFSYKYGWSFAFAAISFLLTEVTSSISPSVNFQSFP